jgi:dihydrodiol dehydrogenase / D-xylose 1-dehydrogenase (NADP)
MKQTVRWGILGPGRISRKFAAGLREAEGAELTAVGSRSRERAECFAAEFGVPTAHGSYTDLALDPGVDAVYIGTPHPFHEEHAILCLERGKHVLCEKPFALNAVQGERMIRAARSADRLLMEAMWTRFLPVMERVRELVAGGRLGDVRLVTADFGFRAPFDPSNRLFDPALGGGALLDLGIYPLTLAFMLLGKPVKVRSAARLGETGVDEECSVMLAHEGGRTSVFTAATRLATPGHAFIHGTEAWIHVHAPWHASQRLTIRGPGDAEEPVDLPYRGGGTTHEAEAFMDLVRAGRRDSEIMPLEETLRILRTMDEIRRQWGLRYPSER